MFRKKPRKVRTGRVRCNICEHRFRPDLRFRETGDGGEELFFECPKCGKRYVAARLTKRGRELRNKIQEFRERITKLRNSGRTSDVAELVEELERLLEELREEGLVGEG